MERWMDGWWMNGFAEASPAYHTFHGIWRSPCHGLQGDVEGDWPVWAETRAGAAGHVAGLRWPPAVEDRGVQTTMELSHSNWFKYWYHYSLHKHCLQNNQELKLYKDARSGLKASGRAGWPELPAGHCVPTWAKLQRLNWCVCPGALPSHAPPPSLSSPSSVCLRGEMVHREKVSPISLEERR